MPSFRAATSAALLFAASAQQLSPWPTTPAVHAPGPITAAATSLPSFPGAVGFGSSATGGRGGAVVRVTTLADAGPGSFRDAVSAPNRTVVFDVGGYIDLASAVLVASDITIAAQTAPGGGIGLSGRELSLSGASNVIVRGLRVRQGSRDPDRGKSAVNIGNTQSVMLDHASVAFGSWDSIDAVGAKSFTVSNCIIADPVGQQFGAHVEVGPGTFVGNVFANAHNRQPLAKADMQFINNVIYDFQAGFTAGNTAGRFEYDVVANLFVCGPVTSGTGSDAYFQITSNERAFAHDNLLSCARDGTLRKASAANAIGGAQGLAAPWAPSTLEIPTLSAMGALASALSGAGAAPRDGVDELVLDDVASLGTRGHLYTTQAATGLPNDGYGELSAGVPMPDSAGSGVRDFFGKMHNISTSDPNAGEMPFGTSGYTNVEVFVNSLVLPPPWRTLDAEPERPGAASYLPAALCGDMPPWLIATSSLLGRVAARDDVNTAAAPLALTATLATLTSDLCGLDGGGGDGALGGLSLFADSSNGSSVTLLFSALSGALTLTWTAAPPLNGSSTLGGFSLPLTLRIALGADGAAAGAGSTDGGATWRNVGASPALVWPQAASAGLFVVAGVGECDAVASFSDLAGIA